MATWRSRLGKLFNYANNITSILGIVLTTVSAILIIVFTLTDLVVKFKNPYLPVFTFMVLPAFFVLGLLLIPIGMWLRRKRLMQAGLTGEQLERFPRLDFNQPEVRRVGVIVLVLTVINAIIFGVSSYMAVSYMDTVAFCGTTCHTVMLPEYTAYQQSPHARVECVQCHIGPGASWFVRTKLDGLRQVWKTVWDIYPTPIKTPVESLRPARATCEGCHWPARHYGDKLRVFARFATDEKNTPSYNVQLLKTGGGSLDLGQHGGIHWWHIYADNRIRYVADQTRQKMQWVELTTPDGKTYVFTPDGKGKTPADVDQTARTMDCVDCHNRPTHLFQVPAKALDQVLENFPDLQTLPYYKKQALKAIKGSYPTHAAGMAAVGEGILTYYRDTYPDVARDKAALVARGADEAARVYSRSVFPEMKTNWETHPNNIGHDDFPGCFRCHDGTFSTADGSKTIPPDCETCHVFLVEDSPTKPDLASLMIPAHAAQ
jgi:hypothetical protein